MPAAELTRDLQALEARLRASTVAVVDGRRGQGSGVLWSDDGLVVTNAHVVRGAQAGIETGEGRALRAATLGRDESADLALLRIAAADLARLRASGKRAAAPRASKELQPGELVFAMGHPLGLANALSRGVVERCNAGWVVSDVRLAPGNSGGPLADGAGRVVGINSMIAAGRGLAVRSERVAELLARTVGSLQTAPAAAKRTLGVTLAPVVAGGAAPRRALLVLAVAPGSAAERSGVQLGDVIVDSDRAAADDAARFTATLGTASTLHVLRAGTLLSLALRWEATSNAAAA